MQTHTAADWDAHADVYARIFAPLTGQLAESLLRLTSPYLDGARRLLDVACGSGATALPLARWARERGATVLATDLAPQMVERTRAAVEADGHGALLTAEVRDGQALGLPDASFDAVFSGFGIFLFPDRVAGWAEAARVLRPGGILAITSWRGPEDNPMARAQMEPLMRALPERLRQRPARSWVDISAGDALQAEVAAAASWDWLRVDVLDATLVLPSPRVAWAAMRDNPMTGALLRQCDEAELARVEGAVLEALSARAGGLDHPLALHASCHALIARRAG